MKSLMRFLHCVLEDLGTRCGTCTSRDSKRVSARVEHEGISFLTISLPRFGKDFTEALAEGRVRDDHFSGFARSGGLPRFLGGFLRKVFDSRSGLLLDEPNVDCIFAIRQFTLMCGKIELPCSPEREQAAFDKFIECEQDLRQADQRLLSETDLLEDFERIGRMLWSDFLCAVDSQIYEQGVIPKHGPGATADKLRGNAKYNQRMWTQRLEAVLPHWENLIPSESFLQRMDSVRILEPRDEIPVKVISVPKTLETPRIIAVEPTCMQYMQQGVLAIMQEKTPRIDQVRQLISSERQEPNQRLAREGSITGGLATLDLSEASDRVSNRHVELLLRRHSITRDIVMATRSTKASVPGHGVIPLTKFASMGSALTFPFEALVFATIVFVGIERALSRPLTMQDVESLYGKVRVYGDDIIVPTDYVQSVIWALESFGLVVNRKKSFWTGKFRESCGKDYYDGRDITIARVRRPFPATRQHADELISAISLRNQLFKLDFDVAVDFLDDLIGSMIPFPIVEEGSAILGRLSHEPCQPERSHPQLHIPLVKGVVADSVKPSSELDDYGALMKWFLEARTKPLEDKDHLERAGRPGSVRIKTRWATPYSYGVVSEG